MKGNAGDEKLPARIKEEVGESDVQNSSKDKICFDEELETLPYWTEMGTKVDNLSFGSLSDDEELDVRAEPDF